ncbi:MAG: hypothetical protein QG624_410 [Pseudomonadota bacterium]|jgi:hypothetical protein|nr:hypothetical protein [Pseudomonadota bacterium]
MGPILTIGFLASAATRNRRVIRMRLRIEQQEAKIQVEEYN